MGNVRLKGFTIVELLIVVVVIAILAAITIVSFNGITNRTHDSAVQSDLSNIAKKMNIYKLQDAASLYPFGATLNDGVAFRLNISRNSYGDSPYQLLNCTNSASQGSDYAILAVSKSGKRFYVGSNTGGVREYTGSANWIASTNVCDEVLPGSTGNGAGYGSSVWRTWTSAG